MKKLIFGSGAVLFFLASTAVAQSHSPKSEVRKGYDPFPEIRLSQTRFKGEAAVQALGLHLKTSASKYKLSEKDFAKLLRTDRSTRVDDRGLLFYEEELPSEISASSHFGDGSVSNNPIADQIPDALAFRLHSRPGARGIIYINHQGQTVTGSSWNYSGPIVAAPYTRDADSNFSAQELQDVKNHWLSVAEDYSPFNIDVTTERPTNIDPAHFIEIIVTPTSQWYGSAGGVCFVGSFTWGQGVGSQVCWVFSTLLGNNVKYVKEAIAHEAGHSFGLHHWAAYDPASGTQTTAYYSGHGSWAPIMGVGYYRPVTTWSKGEFPGAGTFGYNSLQNDMNVIQTTIAQTLPDEAPGTTTTHAMFVPESSSGVVNFDYRGIIANSADSDVFKIVTNGGDFNVSVKPFISAANVDFRVRLLNFAGDVEFDGNPDGISNVNISIGNLTEGTHYLEVTPVGSGDPMAGGYSVYGSAGSYQVVGSYHARPVAGSTPTPTPPPTPTPSPSPPPPTPTPTPSPSPTPPPQPNTPPTNSVTAPAGGTTVRTKKAITISMSAQDNSKVRRVRILVNGDSKCSKNTNARTVTMSCSYNVREAAGATLSITSEATDDQGLVTVSSPVQVNVIR